MYGFKKFFAKVVFFFDITKYFAIYACFFAECLHSSRFFLTFVTSNNN